MAVTLILLAAGCQSYEQQPLDLAGHREAFLARTPEGTEVRDFAAQLAAPPANTTFNLDDGISCSEAEAIGLVFNADLRVARLNAGVTKSTAENAGLWEDPTLGVDLTRIVQGTPQPWRAFAAIGLTIPISGRLEIEKQRAGLEHGAELARVAQSEWNTRLAIRRAWTHWTGFIAQLNSTQDFMARVDPILVVVNAMEQTGEMTRIEARLFRIERASAFAALAVLESRKAESDLQLRQLMGLSPDAPANFRADGIGPHSGLIVDASARADRESLEASSPAMAIVIAEYATAEKTLELEIRKQYPDLSISPGYGSEDNLDQYLLGFSIPLPILNANRQRIAEAFARRVVARVNAESTLEQLISGIRSAGIRLLAAARQREIFESEIVPLVDAQYADARQVAQLGEVDTLVLLESLSRQRVARLTLIEARCDEALAAIDVQEIMGPDPTEPPPH